MNRSELFRAYLVATVWSPRFQTWTALSSWDSVGVLATGTDREAVDAEAESVLRGRLEAGRESLQAVRGAGRLYALAAEAALEAGVR